MTFCDFLLVTHQQGCQIGAEKWADWLKNCIKTGHFQLIFEYISARQARIDVNITNLATCSKVTPYSSPGVSVLGRKWARFAQNRTDRGVLTISFHKIMAVY